MELAHGHAELGAREVRSQAAVHAHAERDVPIGVAVEAHVVAVGELGFVGVGGTEHRHDLIALVHGIGYGN